MDIFHIIILAIIQGLTEFLPISSSAHLILLPELTGWEDQGIAFDVAVHLGSLIAVLMYFRADLKPLMLSWFKSLKTFTLTSESRLVWGVGIGTIPAGLAGLMIAGFDLDLYLRSSLIIAVTTLLFGILLGIGDVWGKKERDEYSLTWKDIIIIGLAQALALIPGTSRSGITITAALFLGLNRKAAARFSFLLAIPIIILAGLVSSLSFMGTSIDWLGLGLAVIFSAFSAYFCIHAFMSLLDRIGMLPFVAYRLGLGILLLMWVV
ncbi:MAG: undecaprenyl-diphosphate phosphatase [Thiomargarita sp.]|nr:undecaprenyl-diphosphate phosphatase [Thiomargarita sp.]